MKKEDNRYIDLSSIPRDNKNRYLWSESIGCRCSFIYGDLSGEVEILEMVDYHKLKVKCFDIVDNISTYSLIDCGLSKLLTPILCDFKYDIGYTYNSKYSKIQIIKRYKDKDNSRMRNYYDCKCLECGGISKKTERQITNLATCIVCCGHASSETNNITINNSWMIPYFQGGYDEAKQYTFHSSKYITPKCPICGNLQKPKKISDIYRTMSSGCTCDSKMSIPEQIMFNLLQMNNISFIHQASKNNSLPWANNYRYDFYLTDYNMIIETHGMQHYKDVKFLKNNYSFFEYVSKNDKLKKEFALQNNISKYYEIDCRYSDIDYIIESCKKSGILEFLNITIDDDTKKHLRNNVNIMQINKCKELCKKHPYISFGELRKELNMNTYTLENILKKLDIKLNPISSVDKTPGKPHDFYVYKNNELIGKFKSVADFSNKMKNNYGITISPKLGIRDYIERDLLYHNTFRFVYADDFVKEVV